MKLVSILLACAVLGCALVWWRDSGSARQASPSGRAAPTGTEHRKAADVVALARSDEVQAGSESARVERVAIVSGGEGLTVVLEFDCRPERDFALTLLDSKRATIRESTSRSNATWPLPPAGSYSLRCEAPEWRTLEQDLEVPEARTPISVTLSPVAWNGIDGRVTARATGAPIERFNLSIDTRRPVAGGGFEVELGAQRAFSAPAGAFCVAGVRTSGTELRLRVRAGDAGTAASAWLPFDGTAWLSGLHVEPALDAALEGRVLEAVGRAPIANARVRRVPPDASLAFAWRVDGRIELAAEQELDAREARSLDPNGWETLSSTDGSFTFVRTPPGELRLLVVAAGHAPRLTEVFSAEPGARGEPLELLLTRGAALRGRLDVIDPALLSVPREVELSGPGGDDTQRIGDDGTFLFDGLVDGVYQVAVREEVGGGRSPVLAQRTVTIREQRDEELAIPLGLGLSGCRVTGEVVLPAEPALTAWRIFAVDADGGVGPQASAEVSATGQFELTDLAPGATLLLVGGSNADYSRVALGATLVELAEAAPSRARIDLTSSAVRLKHAGSHGRIVNERVELTALRTTPEAFGRVFDKLFVPRTDSDGVLWIYGLPPGEYGVSATGVEPQRFVVRAGSAQRFDLELH